MTWIATVGFEAATGKLRQIYERVAGPGNNVDNILMAHSLRPHTLEGHMHLYKYVLHHSGNKLPKHFLESIGVYVSLLNHCSYCVEHHFAGLTRLLNDAGRAQAIRSALERDAPDQAFSGRELAALRYARKLTMQPAEVREQDILDLREVGFEDGEILEINQVTAYFGYANRTVLGLGVSTDGDILGLSPGDSSDAGNWSHG